MSKFCIIAFGKKLQSFERSRLQIQYIDRLRLPVNLRRMVYSIETTLTKDIDEILRT